MRARGCVRRGLARSAARLRVRMRLCTREQLGLGMRPLARFREGVGLGEVG